MLIASVKFLLLCFIWNFFNLGDWYCKLLLTVIPGLMHFCKGLRRDYKQRGLYQRGFFNNPNRKCATKQAKVVLIKVPFAFTFLTLKTLRSKFEFSFVALFISYRSSGEKLIKYQENSSCVIMSVILTTTLFYKALTLQGEIWYWSLLGLKGLRFKTL